MSVAVRFAPSPTGKLHVGNIRSALLNYLFARAHGGTFTLRLDDTDAERSTEENAHAIKEDLAWLGLTWDRTFRQSERYDRYAAVAEDLKARGRLYACYETSEELDLKRKRQLKLGRPPVYDRAGLKLTDADRAKLEAEGRRPHWRFQLTGGETRFTDLVRGEVVIETATLSDPVVIREDGSYLYTFPSVIDDVDFAITHIVRGEDHVTNSAVQIEIFEAMGAPPPGFAHHSLMTAADGEGLSKRTGALSIGALRESGIEPMAILSLLAKLGTSDPVEPHGTLDDLVKTFDFAKFSRAPVRFDHEELKALSAKLLHGLSYDEVRPRLEALGVQASPELWSAMHANVSVLTDLAALRKLVEGPVEPVIEDPDFAAAAAAALPEGTLTEASWGEWTNAVKAATGRKGKELFMPLRLALTGDAHGPEMAKLLPLIGREKILARLHGTTA